jgi:hypothetical protein
MLSDDQRALTEKRSQRMTEAIRQCDDAVEDNALIVSGADRLRAMTAERLFMPGICVCCFSCSSDNLTELNRMAVSGCCGRCCFIQRVCHQPAACLPSVCSLPCRRIVILQGVNGQTGAQTSQRRRAAARLWLWLYNTMNTYWCYCTAAPCYSSSPFFLFSASVANFLSSHCLL